MRREEKKREREGETWVRWCDRREVSEKREETRDGEKHKRERQKEINKKMIELYYSAQYCKNFGIYDF